MRIGFPEILEHLDKAGIPYTQYLHQPVMTVAEAAALPSPIPGTATKNLFLRDKRGVRHFLVTFLHHKQIQLDQLAQIIGADRLSFASPERLMEHLGLAPGAVTPLGLINDKAHAVQVVFDKALLDSDLVQCHPLVNTATLVLTRADLERALSIWGSQIQYRDIPER